MKIYNIIHKKYFFLNQNVVLLSSTWFSRYLFKTDTGNIDIDAKRNGQLVYAVQLIMHLSEIIGSMQQSH